MRLTEKDIGRKVVSPGGDSSFTKEVLGVADDAVWLMSGSGPATYRNFENDWIIVEPEKLPSAKVNDLLVGKFVEADAAAMSLSHSADYANIRIDAMLKVWDEEFEKRKK